MKQKGVGNIGMKRLVAHYRNQFRIPENLNHYSPSDLRAAERKYVKYALNNGL